MSQAAAYAIVYGAPGDPVKEEVVSAVRQQSRPAREVITDPADLGGAVAAAARLAAEWLWLLDGGAIPQPQALEALLEAARQDPLPVLLSSQVLGPDGGLDPGSLPQHVIYATEVSVAAAEHRLVQIRAAGSGSVLVTRQAVLAVARGGADMFELSARILRDPQHIGYLVPGSVASRPHPLPQDLMIRVRSLAGRAWTPREKLREAFQLSRQALGPADSSHRADRGR